MPKPTISAARRDSLRPLDELPQPESRRVRIKRGPTITHEFRAGAYVRHLDPHQRLAEEINRHVAEAQASTHDAVAHAVKAGQALLKAKTTIPHGQWLPWLKQHVPTLSERTAQGYMKVAGRFASMEGDEAQRVADLPLRQVLKTLSAKPPKARESPQRGNPIRADVVAAAILAKLDSLKPELLSNPASFAAALGRHAERFQLVATRPEPATTTEDELEPEPS